MKTNQVGPGSRASEVLSALGSKAAELAVLAGDFDEAAVAKASASGQPVLVAAPGTLARATIAALGDLAAGGRARVFLAREADYAGCVATVRRFLASGRLRTLGHVACLDRCAPQPGGRDGAGYWLSRGGPLLARIGALLGTGALDVIARTDEAHGVTEAYLAAGDGTHVHFTGAWRAAVDSHCFWLEGTGGSLRTDGGAVWWRKRGWRFFAPVRLGGAPKPTPLASAVQGAVARIGRGSETDDREAVAIACAALASGTTRSIVRIVGPGRAAAA